MIKALLKFKLLQSRQKIAKNYKINNEISDLASELELERTEEYYCDETKKDERGERAFTGSHDCVKSIELENPS